ncbi:UPF0357 protein [Golovinomyces cichoracearum]|uniref:UPF0357 protein n=1 Tax=Golovinomyces cichoracearum TaxID=62708 RepID=A0A420HGC1_9PEZI|nr:UPF0357 protein [Golovinomyces cichoracearum]RKF56481.1 UPF0357 protein [Golovinomyces cichoracearum]
MSFHLLYPSAFALLVISSVIYLTRSMWAHHLSTLPGSSYLYSRLPSTFLSDIENGLSSPEFDLSSNVAAGDSRRGLDDTSKREIQVIMKNRRVNFNEARRLHTEARFAKNNIGSDGRPRDPKFVCFS